MTKVEATELAIEFTKEEMRRTQRLPFLDLENRFWQGLLAELQDLLSGEYEESDCVPFICYQTLKDTPVGRDFLEAWGADIGRQGGTIHGYITAMEDGLAGEGRI